MYLEKIGAKDISIELLTKFWNNISLSNNDVARHIVAMLNEMDFDKVAELDNADDLIKQAWKGMNTKIRVNKQQASMIRVNRSGGAGPKGIHTAMTDEEIEVVKALAPAPKAKAEDTPSNESVEVDEGVQEAADTGYAAPSAAEAEEAANSTEEVDFVKSEKELPGFYFYATVLGEKKTFQGETQSKAFEEARKFLVEKRFSKAVIKKNGRIIDVGEIENGDSVTIDKQLVAAGLPQLDWASNTAIQNSVLAIDCWDVTSPVA